MRNPYICGGWVGGTHFYGREELIREVIDGPFPVLYVVGGRRSGKTSLLRRVEAVCLDERKACLFLDLQATGRTLEGLSRVLRMELRSKARHWEHLLWPSLFNAADLFALLAGLSSRAQVLGTDLLLLLDEAEVLLEIGGAHSQLLARLWGLMYENSALRLVLAASPDLAGMDCLLDVHLGGGQLRFLAGLDARAATSLIRQSDSSQEVRVSNDLVEEIMEETGRHPYLLQFLCQRLYQPDHSLRGVSVADLIPDELLGSLFNANCQLLGHRERDVLWLVADCPGQGLAELRERAELDAEALANSLGWLLCLGYVCPRPQGRSGQEGQGFHVADRFLAAWLSEHWTELCQVPGNEYDLERLGRLACGAWPHYLQA